MMVVLSLMEDRCERYKGEISVLKRKTMFEFFTWGKVGEDD
jgi:hypothetical protein